MANQDHGRPSGSALSPVILHPGPSHAEWSRTVADQPTYGTLSTLTQDPPGYPYGSLSHFALDDDNAPLLLISRLAEHTINLEKDPRASLLVAETSPDQNPLAKGRVTLLGVARPVGDADRPAVRDRYLTRVPTAKYYADFNDFVFYRLKVEAVRFIGGFGRMSWVDAAAWTEARPDPIAPMAAGILTHMNEDHAESLRLFCQHFAGLKDVTRADMTEVDRYGFEMQAYSGEGPRLVRLGFPQRLESGDQVRGVMVSMVREAREAIGV